MPAITFELPQLSLCDLPGRLLPCMRVLLGGPPSQRAATRVQQALAQQAGRTLMNATVFAKIAAMSGGGCTCLAALSAAAGAL